jgi:Xaa-Pro aminopeptidase
MNQIEAFITRARVVATSILTILIVAAAVLQAVIAELTDTWPVGAEYASRAAVVLAAVIAAIRHVTPVPKAERGILPK